MRQAISFFAGVAATIAAVPFAVPGEDRSSATAFAAGRIAAKAKTADASVGALRDDNGLFYVEGDVGAQSIRFLVDTGASHVVLSHADARKLGPHVAANDKSRVMTAGGPVNVDWIIIKEVRFDGHSVKNLKAAVPDNDIGVSLLGQNALAQFDAVRIDGDELTLSR